MSGKITTILAIESSCDETACALVQNKDGGLVSVMAETTASSLTKHAETKGIVPEVAAREQIKAILPVIKTALKKAAQSNNTLPQQLIKNIDAIAVTTGPGLIGSLLIGVESARSLAVSWNKPIIPVDHVIAHQYANFLQIAKPGFKNQNSSPTFPSFPILSWVVSGGHTSLYYMRSHQDIKKIGQTVDDSAGECFDKCARVLGYDYPGGPHIERLAEKATSPHLLTNNQPPFSLPRPLFNTSELNTSFSGLKTAFVRMYEKLLLEKAFSQKEIDSLLARELQQAITDIIVKKTKLALQHFPETKSLFLSGGVAANITISNSLSQLTKKHHQPLTFYHPPHEWCTDNAAMIGSFALFHLQNKALWKNIKICL